MTDILVRLHAAALEHRLRWLFVVGFPWLALAAWGATSSLPVLVYVGAVVVFVGWLVAVASGWYLILLGVLLTGTVVMALRRRDFAGISASTDLVATGGGAILATGLGLALLGGGPSGDQAAPPVTSIPGLMIAPPTYPPATTSLPPGPALDSVTDGDTFRIFVDGVSTPVRIIGIDAPEAGDCLADEATSRLEELLEGGFELRQDVSETDGFGRLLRHVDTPEGSAAEVMVEEGLAIARRYPPDLADADRLDELHLAAQSATAGIWSWFTCGTPSSAISTSGDDLLVRNTGTGTLSLGGLAVMDGAVSVYSFPATAALLPGEEATVSSGCGSDSGRRLFACAGAWPALLTIQLGDEAAFVEFPPPPTTRPEASATVEVSGLRMDAAGNDNENKNDEWVEVTNRGEVPADLTGWYLEDEGANHTFRFPSGFTIAAGETVRIRSGCGTGTLTELFWCNSGSAVWNNDGDTAYLFNPEGGLVDWR